MSTWSEGYFTETTYCIAYYREQSPALQRFCLLMSGYDAPECLDGGNYCELGFGQGLTLNINAATRPGAWYGNDFNPEHLCYAQSFSDACGSDTRITDQAFAEFCHRDDLPAFDYVSLHGIWTWVSEENRKHILHLLNTKVRPGGVVYISYNCNPGMAVLAPIRQLLHDYDCQTGHVRSGQRVKAALDFARDLLQKGPTIHAMLPSLQSKMDELCSQEHIYLAHEFLNASWDVMYFSDVAQIMSEARLRFACTSNAQENVQGLGYSQEALEMLQSIEAPILREQAKDYFANSMFRRDLYVRGGLKLDTSTQFERLLNTRMALCAPADKVTYQVAVGMGTVGLDEELHRPIIEMLAEEEYRPKTIGEMHRRANGRYGEGQIVAACAALCGTGNVAPCQSEPMEERGAQTSTRLNRHILQRATRTGDVAFLASPVLGAGVHVPRLSQLFLLAELDGKDPVREALHILKKEHAVIAVDGRPMETPEEEMTVLSGDYDQFRIRLPIYRALRLI